MKSRPIDLQAAPRYILTAGLLLWGWQNDFLIYASLMAVLLETSHLAGWRWSITAKEFNNIADLSGVLFFIIVVYIFLSAGSKGIFIILSILPFIFFLLILTQIYSQQGKIELSALFISLRHLDTEKAPDLNRQIDISLPYFFICLVSASAGNRSVIWYFLACCLLIGFLLWALRPKRYRFITWLSMLVLAFLLAYAGQIGLTKLQGIVEASFLEIFDRFMWRYRDPDRTITAIGSIGRLKFSDRIVLRVKPDKKLTEPFYLREATYNSYGYGIWSTIEKNFRLIDADAGGKSWTLTRAQADRTADISTYMIKETSLIPLPHGTSKINGNGIIEINQNSYSATKMEIREGWVRYSVDYQDQQIFDAAPGKSDLYVGSTYRDDFTHLKNELQLNEKSPENIITTVKKHFADNFNYSLTQKQRYPRGKYLSKFLFESHQGHCEFFATSTVLLLRSAGVPARYAVGYSIQEYSYLEGLYIARARHAHSWALAYLNNSWQIVDTTPSVWAPLEDESASSFEPLIDLWSWLSYRFSLWQSADDPGDEKNGNTLLWLLIPLLSLLAWRFYLKERIKRPEKNNIDNMKRQYPGMDSSFYRLVSMLERSGPGRRQGETTYRWLTRIGKKLSNRNIMHALELHYRYRFDPDGLPVQAKNRLDMLINRIIQDLQTETGLLKES